MSYINQEKPLKIRKAEEADIPLILYFIKETAKYEKMEDDVVATEESILKYIFEKKRANVIIVEFESEPVGYAVYFYNFSTFTGTSGIYLEDIFVKDSTRGLGVGKEIFKYLNFVAEEEGCNIINWACLDWNESSIRFYNSLGAESMDEWISFRLIKR